MQSSCHEVASEFFATNAPGSPHWTLNLFFIAFHTNWKHLGPFGCIRKLSAKRAELVQKFVSRSHVVIFRNKHTGLTPLGCNSCFGAFHTIWVHSGPFGCLTKLGAKRAELVQNFVPRSRIGIFRKERTRSTRWTLN